MKKVMHLLSVLFQVVLVVSVFSSTASCFIPFVSTDGVEEITQAGSGMAEVQTLNGEANSLAGVIQDVTCSGTPSNPPPPPPPPGG